MAYDVPPSPPSAAAFDGLVERAVAARSRRGADALLGLGVDLQAVCRYAAGAASAQERARVERAVAGAPAAVSTVSALVRGASGRGPAGNLVREVLHAAREGAVDARQVVGRALLASGGAPGAAATDGPPPGTSPAALAGWQLLRGDAADVGAALEGLGAGADPEVASLADLARRVLGHAADPDLALAELLSAV